jgi:hypothetical protein
VQSADQGVAALEPAGAAHARVVHAGGHRIGLQVAGPAGDLGVAEAVQGEAGFSGERPLSGQGEGVGGVRLVQGAGGQFAVLEDFGVPPRAPRLLSVASATILRRPREERHGHLGHRPLRQRHRLRLRG